MNNFNITLTNNSIDGDLIQTVEGRQIHSAMEVVKDYPTWVKAQIERAGFVENTDFVKTHQKVTLSVTGQSRTEFHFTLVAGKKIAMMSTTKKGNEVRDYFIACEAKLLAKTPLALSLPQDYIQALEHLLVAKKSEMLAFQHVAALEVVVAEQTVKVDAFDRFATSTVGSWCIRDAASALQVKEKVLKDYLYDNKWVYNRKATGGSTAPLALSTKMSAGLLEHKIDTKRDWAPPQVRVTRKGMAKISLDFEKMDL